MTTGVGCDLIQIHRLFDDPDPAVEHQLRNGLAVQQEDGNCTLLERGLGCVPRESAGGDPLCIRWRPQRDTHLCGSRQYGAPRGERRDGVGCGLLVAETLVPHQRLAAWPSRRTKEDVFDGVVPEAGAGAEGHALLSLLTGLVYAQAVSGSSVRLSMCPEKAPRRGLRGPRQWAALRQGRALRGVRGMSGTAVLMPALWRAVPSRLGRRRPLPRSALGFVDLVTGHSARNVSARLNCVLSALACQLRRCEIEPHVGLNVVARDTLTHHGDES